MQDQSLSLSVRNFLDGLAELIAEHLCEKMPAQATRPPERLSTPDGLVSAKEVAVLLQIPARRVYELAARRELKVVRIGRSLRFRRRDIDAYIENHVEQPFPERRP